VANLLKKDASEGGYETTMTFSEGNLKVVSGGATGYGWVPVTMAIPDTGKWYFEFQATELGTATGGNTSQYWGVVNHDGDLFVAYDYFNDSVGADIGRIRTEAGIQETPLYEPQVNDYVAILVNRDDDEIMFYWNNAQKGTTLAYTFGPDEDWFFATWYDSGEASRSATNIYNGGQLGFQYTPPTGYSTLKTSVVASEYGYSGSILDSTKGFETKLISGTGAEQSVTIDHKPDLTWIKNRALDEHVITDSVRGATKEINSDSTNVESTVAQGLKSFDLSGFTLGTDTNYNGAAAFYISWNWKEASVYGFDIVSFTGTGAAHAESHSLGRTPQLIIVKNLDTAGMSFFVYHKDALNSTDPETDRGYLNDTAVWGDLNTAWNDVAPTTTQFTVGTSDQVNKNGDNLIAYLWASIEGFSKVFVFEGNGNAAGPYVYCGFRPAFIMFRNADGAVGWNMHDSQRTTYNSNPRTVWADADTAEDNNANYAIDFLSNGFKVRTAHASTNTNDNTYVGIAFAEMPGVYGNAF
jgi:hypothetical protein